MILRRIAVALKQQDWTTVLIEFAMVIFGVLIALQLNNWNEARQDRIDERAILVRLHAEVVTAEAISVAALAHRINDFEMRLEELLTFIESGSESIADDACPPFGSIASMQVTLPNLLTVSELTSSGRLNVLANPELRIALLELQQRANVVRHFSEDVRGVIVEVFQEFPEIVVESEIYKSEEGDIRPRFRCDKMKWSQSPRILTAIMLNADMTDAFMRHLSPWAEQMSKVHELVDEALEINHDSAAIKTQP